MKHLSFNLECMVMAHTTVLIELRDCAWWSFKFFTEADTDDLRFSGAPARHIAYVREIQDLIDDLDSNFCPVI